MSDTDFPVALVTGAAQRIGAAISRHLHTTGYNLVLHCRSSRPAAEQLAMELNALRTDSASVVSGEMADSAAPATIARAAIGHWGRLDLLVNNAAAFFPTPLENVSAENFDLLMHTNLRAPLLLAQACAPALARTRGAIINLTDIYHERPLANHLIYNASKSGLASLTRSLAMDLAPDIRVNGISPGAILWHAHSDADYKQTLLAKIPMQRLGTVEDIAEAVGFLASSRYITGQILAVDGGRSLQI